MILGYKIYMKTYEVKPHEADLWSGKDVIDADEQEWIAKEAAERANGRSKNWLYDHTLGYIF